MLEALTQNHITSKETIMHSLTIGISKGSLIKDSVKQAITRHFERRLLEIKTI